MSEPPNPVMQPLTREERRLLQLLQYVEHRGAVRRADYAELRHLHLVEPADADQPPHRLTFSGRRLLHTWLLRVGLAGGDGA